MSSVLMDRLMSYVSPEPNTGCWLWTGTAFRLGYGSAWDGIRLRSAHRLIYEELRGKIPEGLGLDHKCRVRCCVNPDHLEAVTRRVNVLRGRGPTALNAVKTHCCRGHEFTAGNTGKRKDARYGIQCNRAASIERRKRLTQ